MKLTIQITMDSEAFEDDAEAAKILRRLAERLEADCPSHDESFGVHDSNGEWIGAAWITV